LPDEKEIDKIILAGEQLPGVSIKEMQLTVGEWKQA
jgi:hypothetical protein